MITIKNDVTHEIVLQKSRFITHLARVETELEANSFIQKIKKQHWNATHNCSAYVIGEFDDFQKANDDGEPSGTAGIPMLEVLRKRQIKNTVAVVTRYYGGIKLGAGGLIRAYSGAVSEAVSVAGLVERKRMQVVKITVRYSLHGKIENALQQSNDYIMKATHFTDQVTVDVLANVGQEEGFIGWVTNLTNGNVTAELGELEYIEIAYKEER